MNKLPTEMQCSLYKVMKPYRYTGGEYLSWNKDFESAQVKLALAFPDKYEIAISNLGQKILYDKVNRDERFLADRIYAPDNDFRQILTDKKELLSALETKKPAKEFDILGFSLQYELAYPAMLEMIKLSGIEINRNNRKETDPIIAAGGPCCFNPSPVEDFIDIFMIGDGEELIIEILENYKKLKEKNISRAEIIKELAKI